MAIFFSFSTFLNHFTQKWLTMTHWQILPTKWLRLAPNNQFWSFCRFFHLFPQNEAQIDSEWPISPDSQLFPSFSPKHLIFGEISKIFIPGEGGYIGKFFEFFNFFESFHTRVAQNDSQWQIVPKKWLRLTQNGQFWSFRRFVHLFPQNEAQIDSEWPISPDSQLFHLLPPKHLIFGEI